MARAEFLAPLILTSPCKDFLPVISKAIWSVVLRHSLVKLEVFMALSPLKLKFLQKYNFFTI